MDPSPLPEALLPPPAAPPQPAPDSGLLKFCLWLLCCCGLFTCCCPSLFESGPPPL
ncbi:hypothetical protein NMG60_11033193 [Bertholletia excelsa]